MSLATRIVRIDRDAPTDSDLEEAASLLRNGELVAFATETVYGLGADATRDEAVAKIFEAKGRPSFNPLIVHVADVESAIKLTTDWNDRAQRLADLFWPGPLTIVLPKSVVVCDRATAGQGTVGIRIPGMAFARRLIQLAGVPVAAPSANRSNRISPTEAAHVAKDLDGLIPLILDSGPSNVGIESTVIDLSRPKAGILRPGAYGIEVLSEALGELVESPWTTLQDQEVITSPGQMEVHYSPRTPMYRLEPEEPRVIDMLFIQSLRIGLLSFNPEYFEAGFVPQIEETIGDVAEASRRLYGLLHEWDALGLDRIIVVMPPKLPEWEAIRDRLTRASRPLSNFG